MQKVVYNVTKYKKDDFNKISGVGYITEKDLIIACVSKNGKPYIRVFEDCVKNCQEIVGRANEYKGDYYEIREVEFEIEGAYETREIELEYKIWYKIMDK